ncbi:hypothetical protein SELSPUOL_02557 [Selenomonas sputigena ATCC 35185]|uniref:Uncharacterized protein n=1 Tax=Selenomonas sputigena (strain ATCC 35185 / DSM 20758 / CCUG 44933 / VPI D19B-28) TaxID=546271 RepID=C9LYJ6_SELS3|nr:hypothetical protein SELSPUOL_02557 [Selenomonas sputigena ATCC 35185]
MLFVVMMASKRKNIIAFGYCQEMAAGVSQSSSDSIFSRRNCFGVQNGHCLYAIVDGRRDYLNLI